MHLLTYLFNESLVYLLSCLLAHVRTLVSSLRTHLLVCLLAYLRESFTHCMRLYLIQTEGSLLCPPAAQGSKYVSPGGVLPLLVLKGVIFPQGHDHLH